MSEEEVAAQVEAALEENGTGDEAAPEPAGPPADTLGNESIFNVDNRAIR